MIALIVKETIDRASQVLGYLRCLIDTEEDNQSDPLYATSHSQRLSAATTHCVKGPSPDMAGLSRILTCGKRRLGF